MKRRRKTKMNIRSREMKRRRRIFSVFYANNLFNSRHFLGISTIFPLSFLCINSIFHCILSAFSPHYLHYIFNRVLCIFLHYRSFVYAFICSFLCLLTLLLLHATKSQLSHQSPSLSKHSSWTCSLFHSTILPSFFLSFHSAFFLSFTRFPYLLQSSRTTDKQFSHGFIPTYLNHRATSQRTTKNLANDSVMVLKSTSPFSAHDVSTTQNQ